MLLKALNNNRGFTLPELMVVIAIIAIMAGVAMAGFGPLIKREKVRAAAFQFAGDVKEARMLAIERHQIYSVDIDGDDYIVYRGDPNTGDIIRQVTVSDECPGVSPYTPTSFPLIFNPTGIDEENSSLRSVRFVNDDGCYCDVKIMAAGGIRIEEDPNCFF